MTEVWKPIPDLAGYEASDAGRIRSLDRIGTRGYRFKGKMLALSVGGKHNVPYQLVTILGRKYTVHELIMRTFVGPRPDGLQVCHSNGQSLDNRASNLRYGTPSENSADMARNGTLMRGETIPWAKLIAGDIERIRDLSRCGVLRREVAAQFGVCRHVIGDIVNGKTWRHVSGHA